MTDEAYILDDVTFAYGETVVLKVPRLEIPCGKVTALVGPNGSGKTTLLHLLGFIEEPKSGTITFFDERVTPQNSARLRRRVGLLLQNPYLFHMSVAANVEWGLKIRGVSSRQAKERAERALEEIGLAGFGEKRAWRLSGGEAKRAALARILALDTDVLLLDEPLAHTDSTAAAQIEDLVVRLNRDGGKTIVLASHDLRWGQALADIVLDLRDGTPTPAAPVNVFEGRISKDGSRFETGRISVQLPGGIRQGTRLSIDPGAIVLSRQPLPSSMRNTFRGKITAVKEEGATARVQVEAGESFQVHITKASLDLLDLRSGGEVYLSFKSSSVKVS